LRRILHAALALTLCAPCMKGQVVVRVSTLEIASAIGAVDGLAIVGRSVVAVDMRANALHVVSGNGNHFTYSRSGSGPGDLLLPCCLTALDDSTVAVRELGNRRYSLYRVSERGAQFVKYVAAPGNPAVGDAGIPSRGSQLLHLAVAPGDRPTQRMLDLYRLSTERADVEPTIVRSLASGPLSWVVIAEIVRLVPGGRASYTIRQPLGPEYLYSIAADGSFVHARSSSDTVVWEERPDRKVVRIILPKQLKRARLSAAERDSCEDVLREWARRQGLRREQVRFGAPTYKPTIQRLGIDPTGRLWLQLHVEGGEPNRALVYGSDGRQAYSVEWPADIQLIGTAVVGNRGFGVRTDKEGVVSLVSLTLVPKASGKAGE